MLAGRKDNIGTKAVVGSLKESRSKRGSEKYKKIEATYLFSKSYLYGLMPSIFKRDRKLKSVGKSAGIEIMIKN